MESLSMGSRFKDLCKRYLPQLYCGNKSVKSAQSVDDLNRVSFQASAGNLVTVAGL
jgi:hypothetical protein